MLQFPTPLEDWVKYEKANDETVIIFGINEKNKPVPLYHSRYISKKKTIIWLMLVEGEAQEGVPCNHYVPIINLSRLLSSENGHKETAQYCHFYLKPFWSKERLDSHIELCSGHSPCKTIYPSKEQNIMKFTNLKNQQWCPYIVVADGEAFTEQINGCRPNLDRSFTEAYQKHRSSGIAYA